MVLTGVFASQASAVTPEYEYTPERIAKEVATYVQSVMIGEYIADIETGIAYVLLVQQDEQRERAAAALRQSSTTSRQVYTSQGNSAPQATGECGGATNGADRFISRESGGDPNVWNTQGSGAWGCYQIMPGTWAGAGCNELGAHGSASVSAQAECASRLPLSAWSSSGPT